jgi:hypothetical protein
MYCDGEYFESPGFAVPGGCKDTTGAGDAFRTGLLYGLLRNEPVEAAAQMANAVAALKCRKVGCSYILANRGRTQSVPEKTIDFPGSDKLKSLMDRFLGPNALLLQISSTPQKLLPLLAMESKLTHIFNLNARIFLNEVLKHLASVFAPRRGDRLFYARLHFCHFPVTPLKYRTVRKFNSV